MSYKDRLTRFYEQYAPDKVGNVDATLSAYAGKEEAMFKALVKKYGPEPGGATAGVQEVSSGYKDRLTRFYNQYAPDKMGNVDATLSAYAGKEEAMFKALVKKYGPEPESSVSPKASTPTKPSTPTVASDFKDRLTRFYNQYAPDKVGNVDATLSAYAGKEEAMFKALVKKYGPEPGGATAGVQGVSSDYKDRLTRFYNQYAPDKVGSVDATLSAYAGKEEAMFKALAKKYGPEPEDKVASKADVSKASPPMAPASPPTTPTAPTAAAGGGDHRARLTRFYEHHAPDKVGSVDAALNTYAGKEEAMFKALVKKYGPEPPDTSNDLTEDEQRADAAFKERTASKSSKAGEYEGRLRRLLGKYSPQSVPQVPQLMARYKGKEGEMMKAFVKKFGPEPTEAESAKDAANSGPSYSDRVFSYPHDTRSHLQKVNSILEQYDPDNTALADGLLSDYAGREGELVEVLVKKYGSLPPPGAARTQQTSSAPRATATSAAPPPMGLASVPVIGSALSQSGGGGPVGTRALEALMGVKQCSRWFEAVSQVGPSPGQLSPEATQSLAHLALMFEYCGEHVQPAPPAPVPIVLSVFESLLEGGGPHHSSTTTAPGPEPLDYLQQAAVAATLPGGFSEERVLKEALEPFPLPLRNAVSDEVNVSTFRVAFRIGQLVASFEGVVERDMAQQEAYERGVLERLRGQDILRIRHVQAEGAQRLRAMYQQAQVLLPNVEKDNRDALENTQRAHWGGLLKWHRGQMEHLINTTTPDTIKRLERRFDAWKELVGTSHNTISTTPTTPHRDVGDLSTIYGSPSRTPRTAAEASAHRKHFLNAGSPSANQTWTPSRRAFGSAAPSNRPVVPSVRSFLSPESRDRASTKQSTNAHTASSPVHERLYSQAEAVRFANQHRAAAVASIANATQKKSVLDVRR